MGAAKVRFGRTIGTFTLAALVMLVAARAPQSSGAKLGASSLPRYGDTFPPGAVDYFGLTTIDDYAIQSPIHKEAIALSRRQEHGKAIEKLKAHLATNRNDLTGYVLLTIISDQSGRLKETVAYFANTRRASITRNAKTGKPEIKPQPRMFEIGETYAQAMWTSHAPRGSNAGVAEKSWDLFTSKPGSRLEAMLLTSILWWHRELTPARRVAGEYLTRDPDFYQLRVFLAHLWAHGQGPRTRGDGTVDPSTAADSDASLVLKHANMVIKSHPEYAPAYFVASVTPDKAVAKRNLTRFMQGCHRESEWYKRAKAHLERIK